MEISDQELNIAADLWERGCEMAEQLRSELNHTYWTLNRKCGIAEQCRELNQVSINIAEMHRQFVTS